MVWGMSLPSGFGQFFPMGNFEAHIDSDTGDWYDRLNAYYNEQSPEEQKRLFDYDKGDGPTYAGHVADKFIGERGVALSPWSPVLGAIESHEPPQSFVTDKGYKSLGSLIMLNGRILAVDEDFKTIIERLEPGIHEFFPIEIKMPRGKIFPKSYYVLFIDQYFESFSPEESEKESFRSAGGKSSKNYIHEKSKKGVTGLALAKSVFDSAHIWKERAFREWLICFSDELQAEIAAAGFRMPKHYRMKEVSSWARFKLRSLKRG